MSLRNEWQALRLKGIRDDWQVNLLREESEDIERHVIDKLNDKIARVPLMLDQLKLSNMLSWKIVPLQNISVSHGWCTGENKKLIQFDKPSSWAPNSPDTRYVRTANDSFLTQWPNKERENGFNGNFHPNPQGYGAMAEGVLQVVNGLKISDQY